MNIIDPAAGAFPCPGEVSEGSTVSKPEYGVSVRTYIATAITAALSGNLTDSSPEQIARWAVAQTDVLIAVLNEGPKAGRK